MEHIKAFLNEFLEIEAETIFLESKPNLEKYNDSLRKMNSYCVELLQNTFGMIPLKELDEADYYERWSSKKKPNPRHIYKISHYKDSKYNNAYVIYVSERNPDDDFFQYSGSWFVSSLDNELKIIKKYVFGDDMLIKNKFEYGSGLEDISFKTIGKPIEILRYLSPEDDEDSMKHYLAEI